MIWWILLILLLILLGAYALWRWGDWLVIYVYTLWAEWLEARATA